MMEQPILRARVLKRPVLHHVIIAGYVLAPVANVARYDKLRPTADREASHDR